MKYNNILYKNNSSNSLWNKKLLILTMGNEKSSNIDIEFIEPLKELFNRYVIYDYKTKYRMLGVRKTNHIIMELFRREMPDFVLFLTSEEEIRRSTMLQMTKSGAITIGWFFDDGVEFDTYSKWWGEALSYFVTYDMKSHNAYKNLGIDALLSLIFSNPKYFYPYSCSKKYDVSFIGAAYPYRREFFQKMADMGVSVNLFGRDWGDYLPVNDVVRIYNESKINMNLCGSWTPDIKQIKGRIVEIAMSGGFVLTDYAPYLENYFEIGKEVVCFSDAEDAKQKVKYYLSHDDEREQIAKASYERVLRCYTCDTVFRNVFERIEQLESQKKLNYKVHDNTRIEKKRNIPYWPGKSYAEKRGRQKKLARYYMESGKRCLREGYFIVAISEFKIAFFDFPSIILYWPYEKIIRTVVSVWRAFTMRVSAIVAG